jgi:hypothetical protein
MKHHIIDTLATNILLLVAFYMLAVNRELHAFALLVIYAVLSCLHLIGIFYVRLRISETLGTLPSLKGRILSMVAAVFFASIIVLLNYVPMEDQHLLLSQLCLIPIVLKHISLALVPGINRLTEDGVVSKGHLFTYENLIRVDVKKQVYLTFQAKFGHLTFTKQIFLSSDFEYDQILNYCSQDVAIAKDIVKA